MRERIAVYTAVYPAAQRFLCSWLASVQAQTDRDFDLWISLDGVGRNEAIAAFATEPAAYWLSPPKGATIAEVRQHAFATLVKQYHAVVLVDSDDELLPTRVAAARRALQNHDLAGCALDIMDEHGHDLGARFGLRDNADLDTLLPRHNVFGLSNTAYRTELLRRCLPVHGETVLVDWLLATRAWSLNARITFDQAPQMRYRQYTTNTARVLPPFSALHVLVATERVLIHYRCVLAHDWTLPEPQRTAIRQAQARTQQFHQAITTSAATLQHYITALNKLEPDYIWWWCVAHPQLEAIWK